MTKKSPKKSKGVKANASVPAASSPGDNGNLRSYTGADQTSQELASWGPLLKSADGDYLPNRDTIVARSRDLYRNSGWAAGAVSRHLNSVIGAGFRLSVKPDYAALGLTPEWADEFAKEVEGLWRLAAEDPDCYLDAARQDSFNGLLGLAYRHYLIDGEALALGLWDEDKPKGRPATTIQLIDPDRLSNPNKAIDSQLLRSGVELDARGAPIAYHFRDGHPDDWRFGRGSYTWTRVEREIKPIGRRQVIHAYEKERTDQTRGVGMFAPVIERLKMVDKYDRVELQAALLNAVFAAFIESPFDHELMEEALGGGNGVGQYQALRTEFHKSKSLTVDGVRIPTLFPGEKFSFQTAQRPAAQFGAFEQACLRNIASGLNLSYEQLSQDWSSTNYSSARAALLEVWKFHLRQRSGFAEKFATPIFILWFEEQVARKKIKLPGSVSFYEGKAAYCRVRWIGQGRGWVDPVKEVLSAQMRMEMGISTLEDECADQGKDWQEVLQQRRREIEEMKRLGIPEPKWLAEAINMNSSREKEDA